MQSFNKIQSLLNELSDGVPFSLDKPEDFSHGDYATNIAFVLAKKEGVSPKESAENLVPKLKEKLEGIVKDIQPAGPGFINFFLKDERVREENTVTDINISVEKYANKNILVEHSSPNLFKPFHIGHLMNNIIGEFVTRATREAGASTTTISFPSDVSLGIAKAVLMIERDNKGISFFENNDEEVIKYLGDAYMRGVKECEEHEESLNEAKKVLDKMYLLRNDNDDFYIRMNRIRAVNEFYFKKVLTEIGSRIDSFIYESEAGKIGKETVNKHIGTVFTESEGAIVYIPDESRKDINTSVFINSQGHPTYEAKDLGLIENKFKWLMPVVDVSYFITDQEQAHHFKIVLDAASKLGGEWPQWVKKSHHVPHGRMLFKGQKMSSRLGGVPLALDVIGVVEEEVRERAGEKIAHLGEGERKKLEREIALSALRISVLRSKPGLNINFDPETSLSFEGDSGPYLLYTHARCASLLEKGNAITPVWSDLAVTDLEKKLLHFEEELTTSCDELAPQKLVTYLFSVAQLFNSYYASHQILIDGDAMGNAHRLMIVSRTKAVLKKGLYVLGISAPEKM